MLTEGKSLKAANLKWLVAIAVLDVLICVAVAAPESLDTVTWRSFLKSAVFATASPLVLMLVSMFSSELKASLVFWRGSDAYPGHRAFSEIGPRDPRFNMDSLRRNVGELPSDSREQNELWFRLYDKVRNEVTVLDAHRNFLLFRDLTAMSLVLLPVAAIASFVLELSPGRAALVIAIFAVQWIGSTVAARQGGHRTVKNVMVLHALKRRR